MYQNSYETRAFLESEVKSNRMMDSPGGGMSEDSAYGSPENRGKVSKARGGGLGGLAPSLARRWPRWRRWGSTRRAATR